MLILTRKVGETVVIDANIQVTVLGFHGNQIRLGVTAPKAITVDREEIHERKLRKEPRKPKPQLTEYDMHEGESL